MPELRIKNGRQMRAACHAPLGSLRTQELRPMVGKRNALAPRLEKPVSRGVLRNLPRRTGRGGASGRHQNANRNVIEVQHSAMSDAERLSREAFYGNLVWIIDGSVFRDNFDIYYMLPDPLSALAQDLVWAKATRPMRGAARVLFCRVSEAQAE